MCEELGYEFLPISGGRGLGDVVGVFGKRYRGWDRIAGLEGAAGFDL